MDLKNKTIYNEIINQLEENEDLRMLVLIDNIHNLENFSNELSVLMRLKFDVEFRKVFPNEYKIKIDNSDNHGGLIDISLKYISEENMGKLHGFSYDQVIFKGNYDANLLKQLTIKNNNGFTTIK